MNNISLRVFILSVITQLVLFLLLFLLLSFFDFSKDIKSFFNLTFIALYSLLLLLLLDKFTSKKIFFIYNSLCMFFLFEAFKFSQYIHGDLPRYIEQPIISSVFAFIAIVIYFVVILLMGLIVKQFKLQFKE